MEDMAGSKVALGCVSKCSAARLAPPPEKPPENGALTGQLSQRTPVRQLFTLGGRVKSRNCPADVLWDHFSVCVISPGVSSTPSTPEIRRSKMTSPEDSVGRSTSRLGRTAQI